MKKLLGLLCIISTSVFSFGQVNISAAEAKNHTDQVITVCDRIVDAKYLDNSMTKPTLLNLGAAYPNHLLTIVINFDDRKNFSFNPEEFYLNKRVCVTGRVSDFKGKPQIVVITPAEIKIDEQQARTSERSPAGTAGRTGTANPSSTTNPTNRSPNSNSQTSTTSPDTSTRGATTSSTPSGNQTSTTNPVTSTNRGTTIPPIGSGNQSTTTSPVTTTNRGNPTNPTASNTQTNTSSVPATTRTNTTANNTNGSAGDFKISSAYSIEVGPNLRIRSGPGESFGILEVTKAGSEVTVLGSENGWSHVTYEKESPEQGETITIDGYIKNSVLNSTNTPSATSTTAPPGNQAKKVTPTDSKTINNDADKKTAAAYSITISSNLRVRSEPSDDAEVLEVIKAGTVVSVIRSQNGWSYVSYKSNVSSANSKNQTQNGYIKNSVLK